MNSCIVMAALGRPLYPGMLYNCCSDSFIPGVTLWDRKEIQEDLDVQNQPTTNLQVTTSDTLNKKSSLLDVSASLKASFFSGLVEVGGSAKYLNDTKSSSRQSRVTMLFSKTTQFEQLTMKDLGHINYPQVFEQKTATHVVTAVLYGAHAFMIFDHETANNEREQNIERNIHAVIKKIPSISIDGNADLKMTEDEQKLADKISVTFYGDYELEQNPTTFKEALDLYKKLPSLMKEGNSKGVPVTVWLYPLTYLDSKAAQLVREIATNLIQEIEKILEDLGDVKRRCNDLIANQMLDYVPEIKERLRTFQHLHGIYVVAFQKELSRVLPAIRNGSKEDQSLEDIISTHYRSPYSAINMNKWLNNISTEIDILNMTKDLPVEPAGSLNSLLLDSEVDDVVCFSFTSLKFEDSYLVELKTYVEPERLNILETINEEEFSFQATDPWIGSPDIFRRTRQNLSLFKQFVKAKQKKKRIRFIIASIPDNSNTGTSIRLYQNGTLTDPKYQPVSKPSKHEVKTSDGKITLKLSKSPTGETVRFRVEYRLTPPTDSAPDDGWTVKETEDAQNTFTLSPLQPAVQYWVRHRAVSDVGVSEASDFVPFICDQIVVPLQDFSTSYILNYIRTNMQMSNGSSRWSVSIKSNVNNPNQTVSFFFKVLNCDGAHPVCSPGKRHDCSISGGLRPDLIFYFKGVVPSDCHRFQINMMTEESKNDIAFHYNPRLYSDTVVCNSFRNGQWKQYTERSGSPFEKGKAFEIIMVIKLEGYEVYVDGSKSCKFGHRMPMERVIRVVTGGDVFINSFAIIEVHNVPE